MGILPLDTQSSCRLGLCSLTLGTELRGDAEGKEKQAPQGQSSLWTCGTQVSPAYRLYTEGGQVKTKAIGQAAEVAAGLEAGVDGIRASPVPQEQWACAHVRTGSYGLAC